MSLHLQLVQVAAGFQDKDGNLVFADRYLVAVLVQLSDEHEDQAGRGFLEAGFGRVDDPNPPTFANLEEAQGWIEERLRDASSHVS